MMQNLTKDVQQLKNQSGSSGSGDTSSTILEELQTQINENKSTITNLTNKDNTNNIFLQTYPVGSIYVTNDSINPGTKFGGTWVTYGEGRTLVGVDSTQTEFATVGFTGGEKTHTLTIDEMPSHNHGFEDSKVAMVDVGKKGGWGSPIMEVGTDNYYAKTSYISNKGGSQPHNNLQPYITVYMWKRTA